MRLRCVTLIMIWLLAAALISSGCSKPSGPSGSKVVTVNEAGEMQLTHDDRPVPDSTAALPPAGATRDDGGLTFENPFEQVTEDVPEGPGIVGRWLLAIPRDVVTMVARPWLLDFSSSDDSYAAKVVDKAVEISSSISELKKADDRVTFNLLLDEQPCSFEGTLVDGRIQGTLEVRGQITIAWLERSKLKRLTGVPAVAPAPGSAEYEAVQRLDDVEQRVKELRGFAERFATSPLAFDALQTVLRLAKTAGLAEADVRAATNQYLELARPWGPRWTDLSVENIAYTAATFDANAAVALEFAEKANASLSENSPARRRNSVRFSLAVALLRNDRAEECKTLLDELRDESGDDDVLRFYRALTADKLGDFDGAVDGLVGLWPHPEATRDLERVWKAKHGSLAELDTRLDAEYLKRFPPIAVEPYAGRPVEADNRIAVAELFTGANCQPCIAADLAFEALARAFKRDDLVLLQYHLHVPGPDPMTNGDAEARADYYNVPGTPVLFVNGKVIAPVGGRRQESEDRYHVFRSVVEKELQQKSEAKLNVTASRDGDTIAIEANVSGVAEPSEKLRLRLAVVEESVRFSGLNGLRLHHAVVRAMPGGPAGIAVTDATLDHKTTVNVAELKASLADSLAKIEKELAYEFPAKPLDLEHLGVVAILQDDSSKEVLQSVFLSLASPAKAALPDAEQKPPADAKVPDAAATGP